MPWYAESVTGEGVCPATAARFALEPPKVHVAATGVEEEEGLALVAALAAGVGEDELRRGETLLPTQAGKAVSRRRAEARRHLVLDTCEASFSDGEVLCLRGRCGMPAYVSLWSKRTVRLAASRGSPRAQA
jgi:hypothetical protein